MTSNKLVLASLGVLALVGAAAGGAYFGSRPDPVTPAALAAPPVAPGEAVEATEAVLEEAAVPPEPAPPAEATPPPAPPRRAAAREVRRTAKPTRPAPARAPEPAPVREQVVEKAPPPEPPAPLPGERPSEVFARTEPPAITGPAVPALPPEPEFEELTVPANSVIGLQFRRTISSETARVEDGVEARVTRDVRADGRVVVPSGSRVIGSVNEVERGGKMKERARLGVRFHTLILADGTELPLQTETVYREGDSPGSASAAKIGGGAIGGAILGGILGGGKGAAIGSAIGAAGGTTAVMAGGRRAAEIEAGSTVTVKLLSPVTVTVER